MISEFKYKPTTAFWKIHKLINDALSQFKPDEKKVLIIQGGQGAGKTIAILMLIIDYINTTTDEVTITSAELSKLKKTALNDFLKIMKDFNIFDKQKFNKSDSTYTYDTGHFVEFIGLDQDDVGKGRRRGLVYVNEANKTTLNRFIDITARAELTIIDYNPDKQFWAMDLITPYNFINLTFLDNEFLSENEIRNILDYKRKGYNEDGTIKNPFYANKWRIYGLGEVGSTEGRIYYWNKCTLAQYNQIDAKEYIGCDWGKVDPFAIVGVKYFDGQIYVHEYNYLSENELMQRMNSSEMAQIKQSSEGLVSYLFNKLAIPKDATIIADSNRPEKIQHLYDAGWYNIEPIKYKHTILKRIEMMQELEVFYTDVSKNIENEQLSSCWKKDRAGNSTEEREDVNNHTLDSIEYVVLYLKLIGVIK